MLRLVPEITRVRFYTLVDHFQSPELAFGASAQEIAALRGFTDEIAHKVLEAPFNPAVERELELREEHGATVVTLEDDNYPENLRQSSFPPPLLYVRGTLVPEDKYAVAIVGSRHATQYGKSVTQQFATRLSTCGLTIVSGFARGVDSRAHDATVKAGGRTIGVLGNGLAVCYPAENQALGDAIAGQGALVSEYPMETQPDRFNFPERNRIIAALSLGTLVVEAAEKSGALITAAQALEENRFVFAVPGDINRLNSRGSNKLIQSGARLVQRAEEILEDMREQLRGYLREDAGSATEKTAPGVTTSFPQIRDDLTEDEQYVLEFIRQEPRYFDVLASLVDIDRMPVQRLSSVLLGLELKQAVKQMPGRLYSAPL